MALTETVAVGSASIRMAGSLARPSREVSALLHSSLLTVVGTLLTSPV